MCLGSISLERSKAMKRLFSTSLAIGTLFLTAAAFASSPQADTEKAELVSRLEQRADRLEWQAQGTKGVPRAHLQQQSLRLKNLIKRLEAGESVDPQEIDTLLQQRGY
jgi:hypothetical protein